MLGDGNRWGINIGYSEQIEPNGLAEGITLSEKFIEGSPSALILGDNLFHGSTLMSHLKSGDSLKTALLFLPIELRILKDTEF